MGCDGMDSGVEELDWVWVSWATAPSVCMIRDGRMELLYT